MVKLSLPTFTLLTLYYTDGEKSDHLFLPMIVLHERGRTVFVETLRDRNMHKINGLFTDTISVDVEGIGSFAGKRPRFYYGVTFISLYFRKARSNWFKIE